MSGSHFKGASISWGCFFFILKHHFFEVFRSVLSAGLSCSPWASWAVEVYTTEQNRSGEGSAYVRARIPAIGIVCYRSMQPYSLCVCMCVRALLFSLESFVLPPPYWDYHFAITPMETSLRCLVHICACRNNYNSFISNLDAWQLYFYSSFHMQRAFKVLYRDAALKQSIIIGEMGKGLHF